MFDGVVGSVVFVLGVTGVIGPGTVGSVTLKLGISTEGIVMFGVGVVMFGIDGITGVVILI